MLSVKNLGLKTKGIDAHKFDKTIDINISYKNFNSGFRNLKISVNKTDKTH